MSEKERRDELKKMTMWELLDRVVDEYHRNNKRIWSDHFVLQELESRVIEARRTRDGRTIADCRYAI